MYLTKIEKKVSTISSHGVFALEKIQKGTIVWKYDKNHDKAITVSEYNSLDEKEKETLTHVAYLSATSGMYIYPPENDPARFTNHSTSNNLTVIVDTNISEEPYFVANRDIDVGEEITNNYMEFDEAIKNNTPEWI